MCPFIIVVIIIALVLFMPAVYAMGIARGIVMERYPCKKEGAEGGADTKNVTKGLPSTQPQTKCTRCQKYRVCQNPPPGLAVFC